MMSVEARLKSLRLEHGLPTGFTPDTHLSFLSPSPPPPSPESYTPYERKYRAANRDLIFVVVRGERLDPNDDVYYSFRIPKFLDHDRRARGYLKGTSGWCFAAGWIRSLGWLIVMEIHGVVTLLWYAVRGRKFEFIFWRNSNLFWKFPLNAVSWLAFARAINIWYWIIFKQLFY